MAYEYDLRSLFRPSVDHLPPSEQLQFYRRRDLVPSHLHRLGTGIFGSEPVTRKRVFDASLYSPPHKAPHSALLRRSFDGRSAPLIADSGKKLDAGFGEEKAPKSSHSQLDSGQVVGKGITEYRKWLSNRQHMRSNLERIGANEQWLLSKERNPLENTLLSQLKEKGKATMNTTTPDKQQSEPCTTTSKSTAKPTAPKRRSKYKKQMLKEVSLLEQHLTKHRQRLAVLLMTADRNRDYLITVDEFLIIMDKLRVPTSQSAMEIVLTAICITKDGQLDYRILLNGSLLKTVDDHFQCTEVEITVSPVTANEHSGQELHVEEEAQAIDTNGPHDQLRHLTPSTMDGENGKLSDDYKQEELRQFNALIAYCNDKGIVLSCDSAEKALLLPADHPKEECVASLKQPGLVHSTHIAETSQEEEKHERIREEFGGAYQELRGKRKAAYMRLSTGAARVKAKTDCWLTFREFQKLTKRISSQPGFKYIYHGLPDNNSFWAGALLDKLRLWQPSETLLDKPYSLYNIFQPVQHPKISNPHSPIVEQRTSWPENESGYVQFGSQNRKKYHV